ncbi:MAG: phenylalanine--tRNA ligase subunit beta [Planctomycetaceae bacterium]|nr:phenylalanine--tRNA ligase subunit beta [Planctomycetaceae bacterium]
MLVSWNWLKEYVSLDMPLSELEERLAMSGLNHEGTQQIGEDLAIDLEVTSNRPDCLGHMGVAREISVLWECDLQFPGLRTSAGSATNCEIPVRIEAPKLCSHYTARVIRGVQVAASPQWMSERLSTIGLASVNNVVDATNYVLMESGQPLHAFDLGQLEGPEIVVREPFKDETFEAIDHRTYQLKPGMCVIGDAARAVALGGVMGGAATEVSATTTDVLIEAADFAPLPVRNAARRLNLHSPASYRFERGVDPAGIDWASRRCCDLILDLAGGTLLEGCARAGGSESERPPLVLRFSQLKRILGIEVSREEVRRILSALGCRETKCDEQATHVAAPSWRRDLTREIDLVEEVARIHGYDQIPEDVGVPMAPSHRSDADRVVATVRRVLTSAGIDEAMTCSLVPLAWCQQCPVWADTAPLLSEMPMKGVLAEATQKKFGPAEYLRQSLIPSLLESRRYNEAVANPGIELFEIARVYLPQQDGQLVEQSVIAITSGRDFSDVKGVIESVLAVLDPSAELEVADATLPFLSASGAAELRVAGRRLGILGAVSEETRRAFGLRSLSIVAELSLEVLEELAELVPQHSPLSQFPAITRDLNLVVDEAVRWEQLAKSVRRSAGSLLEELQFQSVYRDPQRDGQGKKRMIFSMRLRSSDRTLTGDEADHLRTEVVKSCCDNHGAELLG